MATAVLRSCLEIDSLPSRNVMYSKNFTEGMHHLLMNAAPKEETSEGPSSPSEAWSLLLQLAERSRRSSGPRNCYHPITMALLPSVFLTLASQHWGARAGRLDPSILSAAQLLIHLYCTCVSCGSLPELQLPSVGSSGSLLLTRGALQQLALGAGISRFAHFSEISPANIHVVAYVLLSQYCSFLSDLEPREAATLISANLMPCLHCPLFLYVAETDPRVALAIISALHISIVKGVHSEVADRSEFVSGVLQVLRALEISYQSLPRFSGVIVLQYLSSLKSNVEAKMNRSIA